MRFMVWALTGSVTATCTTERTVIKTADKRQIDMIAVTQQNRGGGVVHCSAIWPNEDPELALYPVPPGCLYIGVDASIAPKNAVAMKTGSQEIYWVPESEYPNFKIASFPVTCDSVISRTNVGSKSIIIGEGCFHTGSSKGCGKPEKVSTSISCALDELDIVTFGQDAGWHRTLVNAAVDTPSAVGYQWLPRQMFAEPDELTRKKAQAHSVTENINIENPSLISPPQILQVRKYPVPVHARVNPPKNGESHFTVNIPKTVWMVDEDEPSCAVGTLNLADLAGIPSEFRLGFVQGKRLLKTINPRGTYAVTQIPSGNPQDLFLAVVTTATTAVAGALAIILAAMRK